MSFWVSGLFVAMGAGLLGAEPTESGRRVEGIALYGGVYKTEPETVAHIEKCRAHGITMLIPSLSGGGTVLWKTDKADYYPAHRKEFEAGFDGLRSLIEHARAAGIRVYPSVAVCPGGRIIAEHPEWETRDRLGRPSSVTTADAVSLAYPEARRAKVALLMDLVTGYEVDGVLLDYCRYPENSSKPEQRYGYYGYDTPLIEACLNVYGFDPRKEEIDSPNWKIFNAMRAESVNCFVREFRDAVRQSGRSIRIGGFGDTDPDLEARSCGRDWSAWARRGLIDDFLLATYTEPIGQMAAVVQRAREAVGPKVVLLSALCPFNNFLKTNEEMIAAAKAQMSSGADGLWIYREDYLTQLNLWAGAKSAGELTVRKAGQPAQNSGTTRP